MLDSFSTLNTILRHIVAFFDYFVYFLLKSIYELLFSVASFNVVDNEMFYKIFARVQLVLGVFMLFQLVMIILRGIANPDMVTDSKSNGAANVVMRVMVSLALLALIIPINIKNPKNEYERQLRNGGVLFGTLYSLQYRVLSNNTLGRLILGDSAKNYTSTKVDHSTFTDDSSRFVYTVVKMFYTLNIDPQTGEYVCKGTDHLETVYSEEQGDPLDIIALGADSCSISGKKHYRLSMNPISTIAGIMFTVVLFMMVFNVAKRSLQLATLQIMAPIPIISYMDPKGSKDGMFNAWVKLLGTTYLELFIQLGAIYFAFFIFDSFLYAMAKQVYSGTAYHPLTFVVMALAVFIFAKDAPKFIKQMLGLKDNGGKFFSAFGQAMGLGVTAVSAVGSGVAGYRSSVAADRTRAQLEGKDPDVVSGRFHNRAKHVLAGFAGGIGGVVTGTGAALSAKDHNARAAWDAMQKQNAARMARGNDGSTLIGRMGSTVQAALTGEGQAAQLERDIAAMEARQKALDAISSRVSGEMVKKDWTFGAARNGHEDVAHNSLDGLKFNYKNFAAQMEQAKAAGSSTVTVVDSDGNSHVINYATAELMKGQILQSNEDNYIKLARNKTFEAEDGTSYTDQQDLELVSLIEDARTKGGSGWDASRKVFDRTKHGDITSRDDYKKSSEGVGQQMREARRRNTVNKANDQHSKDKK